MHMKILQEKNINLQRQKNQKEKKYTTQMKSNQIKLYISTKYLKEKNKQKNKSVEYHDF